MSFEIDFSEEFFNDIKKHQKSGNKILLKKIDSFLTEIRENPTEGTGKPEQLNIWIFQLGPEKLIVNIG